MTSLERLATTPQFEFEKLTDVQKRYVTEYLQNGGIKYRAYNIATGRPEDQPASSGRHGVMHRDCKHAIQEHFRMESMEAAEVTARLTEQARASIAMCYSYNEDIGGYILDLNKIINSGLGHLIKSITPGAYGTKVELHSQQAALKLLGQSHGIFTEGVDLNVKSIAKVIDFSPPKKDKNGSLPS